MCLTDEEKVHQMLLCKVRNSDVKLPSGQKLHSQCLCTQGHQELHMLQKVARIKGTSVQSVHSLVHTYSGTSLLNILIHTPLRANKSLSCTAMTNFVTPNSARSRYVAFSALIKDVV